MKTTRSAKRVILFLIGLNIVTILTSVTLISSGMFVANAASLKPPKTCKPSTSTSGGSGTSAGTDQSTTPTIDTFYTSQHNGQITSDKGTQTLASLTVQFQGDSKKQTITGFTTFNFSQENFQFSDVKFAPRGDGSPSSIGFFEVDVTDHPSGNPVHIIFSGGRFSKKTGNITGRFSFDAGGNGVTSGNYALNA